MEDRLWMIAIVSAILFVVIVILWPRKNPPK